MIAIIATYITVAFGAVKSKKVRFRNKAFADMSTRHISHIP